MRTQPHRTSVRPTLLVFTLSATGESGRRPLLPFRLRSAEIGMRRGWLDAVLDAGRQTGCRLMVCSPQPADLGPDVTHLRQEGASFGERLRRAFEAALAVSRGPVVMVGSDAPGLSAEHVRDALDRLSGHPRRVVLGPSLDGGLYLLAARAPIPGLGSRVRWCRRGTLASLSRLLAAAGRERVELASLRDLDRPSDLDRWLLEAASGPSPWRSLVRQLRRALAAWRRPGAPRVLGRAQPAVLVIPSLRGPPPPPRRTGL